MKSQEGLGSVKRFGARYGRKTKHKFSQIETEQRKLHKCPYCNKVAVKRVSMGIWNCRKCDATFTGKAYSISRQIIKKEAKVEEQPVVTESTEQEGVSQDPVEGPQDIKSEKEKAAQDPVEEQQTIVTEKEQL